MAHATSDLWRWAKESTFPYRVTMKLCFFDCLGAREVILTAQNLMQKRSTNVGATSTDVWVNTQTYPLLHFAGGCALIVGNSELFCGYSGYSAELPLYWEQFLIPNLSAAHSIRTRLNKCKRIFEVVVSFHKLQTFELLSQAKTKFTKPMCQHFAFFLFHLIL